MMAINFNNAGAFMFNIDRWTAYSFQKAVNGDAALRAQFNSGILFPMTPKQIRRCKKKARKNSDFSIG